MANARALVALVSNDALLRGVLEEQRFRLTAETRRIQPGAGAAVIRRIAKLIALLQLVFYAGSVHAADTTLFRCKTDGVTRTKCCCADAEIAQPADLPRPDTVEAPLCCDVHRVEYEIAPAVGAKTDPQPAPKAVALIEADPVAPCAVPIHAPTFVDQRRRSPGPPILRLKCTLLL
jgi:hypothetical protein